jgi:hypothetical protein
MKTTALITALFLGANATAADATCTVEYKARSGTEYVHTRALIPDTECTPEAATVFLTEQLASQGVELLSIVKVTPGG